MNGRLIHDKSWKASIEAVGLIAHLLREEEVKDARAEVYEIVKSVLEEYVVEADRMQKRMKPSAN